MNPNCQKQNYITKSRNGDGDGGQMRTHIAIINKMLAIRALSICSYP